MANLQIIPTFAPKKYPYKQEQLMKSKWTLENDVNDWVKEKLNSLNLKKHTDWNEETSMSDYLKEALKGSAKTKNKTNFGIPDFHIEKYYEIGRAHV